MKHHQYPCDNHECDHCVEKAEYDRQYGLENFAEEWAQGLEKRADRERDGWWAS